MTAKNRKMLLIGAVVAGAGYLWYRSRQPGAAPLLGGLLGGSTGLNVNPSGGAGSPSLTPIEAPTIIQARDAATGPLSRKACLFPMRWINTTTGPYYGHCVNQAQFAEWIKQPGGAQGSATEASFRAFYHL